MTETLWIDGPLPNLNDIVKAAKSGRGKFNGYGRLKAHWTANVAHAAHYARMPVFCDGPVTLVFDWHEKDRRRDKDGITAAMKFCCDGLVTVGVLRYGDGWAGVKGFTHSFQVSSTPGVMVTITDE